MSGGALHLRDEDCAVVVGIRGAGKSHYVKRRVVRPAKRVVVWDPNDEYREECELDACTVDELVADPAQLADEHCRIAVVPEWDEPGDLAEQFRDFKREVKTYGEAGGLPTLIAIDECGLLRPGPAEGHLVALAAQSRHWRMPLVFVAQRLTMLPPGARGQASIIIAFRQNDARDLAALAERPGFGDERAERVGQLARRRFVVWTEDEAFRHVNEDSRE